MILQESGENYLEKILMLKKEKGIVRSIDIANAFGYTKASVSRAMSILKNNNLITMEAGGDINLTSKGETLATAILDRHLTITSFLENLGIAPEIAEKDACRIEHIISDETFACIKNAVKTKK